VLVVPQIRVGYDETRFGRGDRHPPALFWLKHGVEMGVPLVHARVADRLNPLVG
jgi:hypothetical protein